MLRFVYPPLLLLFVSLWAEAFLLGHLSWFSPNLFCLCALIFILHWRGPEVHFLAAFFGILADSFSSIPFGTYGLVFFLLSFPARWYAVKIFQEVVVTLPVLAGTFAMACHGLVYLLLFLLFGEDRASLVWVRNLIWADILPTAALIWPYYLALLFMEERLNINLSQRKF
ncbi:MAG: hypothetical protein A2527_03870 [Candidatus Lambdaproteobacteria bacterium RIFOXYD2_FULL_50_16]|uniref:Rod shape-determining protein MreD n=1 Tax=Candidatus Lambdaproteobacteria bacterium RIFOXYD2_FULL_50_16 TaxID=1817772 RepID=A0A1F6GF30_9PROT|nr:MAG: hypothetical protein A2527_03870 [Candidatus Lambdaproteobacteria bacterium RIFOXYD2_FULL_50_16]